jgi:hypothetical protein
MAKRGKGVPNKSAFVRDFIQKNPQANRKAVEEAWLAAGHDGVISSALVSNLRSKLGLTAASKKADSNGTPESASATSRAPKRKKRGRPSKRQESVTDSDSAIERKPRSGGRGEALAEIEADFDRIIFRLIALGGMEDIEDELRRVRRRLILSQGE